MKDRTQFRESLVLRKCSEDVCCCEFDHQPHFSLQLPSLSLKADWTARSLWAALHHVIKDPGVEQVPFQPSRQEPGNGDPELLLS